MRHLNLASMRDRVNMDEVAAELASSCPYLESVDFWKSRTLTATGVRALSHCTNLREVDFGWWYVLIFVSHKLNKFHCR